MTRTGTGDFVIKARTIKMVGAIIAAVGILGPTLGVGVAWITRDVSRDAEIRQLKEKVSEINGDLNNRLERIDNRLGSIEEHLRK